MSLTQVSGNMIAANTVFNSISANNGLYSVGSFTGTYTNGAVLDYAGGLGRLSVGSSNGLAFYNGGVANTELMRIDSSGNMGLGVTPKAWSSSVALQIGSSAAPYMGLAQMTTGTADGYMLWGGYLTGNRTFAYSTTGDAPCAYRQNAGAHAWFTAASGAAGNPITFTQAMTLDASGNLGIGTSLPSSFGKFVVADNTAFVWNVGANNTASATVGVPAAGVPTSFAVNLPTHSTYYPASFYITGSHNGSTNVTTAELHAVGVKYGGWSSNIAFFTSSGTSEFERARIDSSGNLLVGMTSAGYSQNGFNANINQGANIWGVGVGGNSVSSSLTGYSLYSTSGSAYKFYVQYSGNIYATSTTITAISDQRLKENIRDLDDGLSTILALKPRKFDWKEGKGKDIKDDRGFIAQEFEQVFPDLIDTWKDPAPEGEEPYKSVRPDLIPVMVKAIQELSAELNELKAKINQ